MSPRSYQPLSQLLRLEIAYCNDEMARAYENMHALVAEQESIDARVRACEQAIARYKLQLDGALAQKTLLFGGSVRI